MGIEIAPPVKLEGKSQKAEEVKESPGKVVGRWGVQEAGKLSGSPNEVLRLIEEAMVDERKGAEFYRNLASRIRQKYGSEYFHLVADIESIANDELNHLSRLTHIKSVLEKL